MPKDDKSRARNLLVIIGAVVLMAVGIIAVQLVSQPPADFNPQGLVEKVLAAASQRHGN